MKWMIASDIHGSAYYCRKMLDAFEKSGAERLFLLGDLLYHGPRNDLPREYAPKEVILMLNRYREKIFCVRGNCDTEVDQMVLDYPIMADYAVIPLEESVIYATHGHLYGEEHLPPVQDGDILLCGHTHVPAIRKSGNILYVNPGSVSIPKEDSGNSYIIFEDGKFVLNHLR